MTTTLLRALPQAAALLAMSCSSPTAPVPTAGAPTRSSAGPAEPAEPATAACVERLTVGRDDSVFEEQRRLGAGLSDFQKQVRAVAIDETTFVPVQVVARHRLDDRPLMWFPPDRRAAVVDARVFSDLAVADPTHMQAGEVATVGRLAESARGRLPGRDLTFFLLRAGVIQTYWHIEADLCLVSEGGEGGAYEAVFDGEHVYYTNEENRDRVTFTVRVAADGTITVIGR